MSNSKIDIDKLTDEQKNIRHKAKKYHSKIQKLIAGMKEKNGEESVSNLLSNAGIEPKDYAMFEKSFEEIEELYIKKYPE